MNRNQKVISSLTELEVRSAIRRRERFGDISESHAKQAIASLISEVHSLQSQPITATVLDLAALIIDRQGLRALDGIQLATALRAAQQAGRGDQLLFVTFDDKLLFAANAEGLDLWSEPAGAS